MRVYNAFNGNNSAQTGLQTLTFCGTGDMYIRSFSYDPTTNPATFTSTNGWQRYAKSSELTTVDGRIDTLYTNLGNVGVYPGSKQITTAFDFNDMQTPGFYYINPGSDVTLTNYPGSSQRLGWLRVEKNASANYCLQYFIEYDNSSSTSGVKSRFYYRNRLSSSWYPWRRVLIANESTFVGNITFASSGVTDLDTYKTQGVYGFVSGNATNANSANFPAAYGGILLVFGNGGTNITQIYITYGMHGIYYRQGSFSTTPTGITWKCILDGDTNKIVEISQNGGSSLKLPNYTSYTYEYCVYEFDSTSKAFSNMYVGSAAGNTSITTPSSSKIYRGWYRRIY